MVKWSLGNDSWFGAVGKGIIKNLMVPFPVPIPLNNILKKTKQKYMLIYFIHLLIMCISINYTLSFEQPVSNYSDLSLTVS